MSVTMTTSKLLRKFPAFAKPHDTASATLPTRNDFHFSGRRLSSHRQPQLLPSEPLCSAQVHEDHKQGTLLGTGTTHFSPATTPTSHQGGTAGFFFS